MMNLPDYLQCVEIRQLHAAMGILEIPELPVLPPHIFEQKITETIVHKELDPKEVQFDEELKNGSISVSEPDFKHLKPDELLEINGRKVSAYIRDHSGINYGSPITTTYRYHLCNCQTIQTMKSIGREARYVKTKRDDGFFEVYDREKRTDKPIIIKMELCQHCIKVLRSKDLYFYPFNLKKYFEKNDTYIPKTIRRIETVTKVQAYTPNQEVLSKAYKQTVNFICQQCHVNCSNQQHLLHLHHINGDKSDNSRSNLQVLCVDCHSSKPLHSQVSKNINYKEQIKLIKKMRVEQGLLMVSIKESQ